MQRSTFKPNALLTLVFVWAILMYALIAISLVAGHIVKQAHLDRLQPDAQRLESTMPSDRSPS